MPYHPGVNFRHICCLAVLEKQTGFGSKVKGGQVCQTKQVCLLQYNYITLTEITQQSGCKKIQAIQLCNICILSPSVSQKLVGRCCCCYFFFPFPSCSLPLSLTISPFFPPSFFLPPYLPPSLHRSLGSTEQQVLPGSTTPPPRSNLQKLSQILSLRTTAS